MNGRAPAGSARTLERLRAAALVCLSALSVSCGDSKSGPNAPVSIEFKPPQLPSMLIGDSLRDTLGRIDSLRAVVFNASGDTIQDAPLIYRRADTTHIVTIDSIAGHVVAQALGSARVVAQTSGLQSPPDTIWVVSRPDQLITQTAANSTIDFAVKADSLFPLSVTVSSESIPVDHWRIEYSFLYPASFNDGDSTHVLLTGENAKFSLVDTTGISGVEGTATRFLHKSTVAQQYNDTVVVEARAFYPDRTVVPGSPMRFKVLVHIP
ncbi:MAG: hypothetical protein ABIQ10_06550 [Gemmatimonadaceae bacterium]